MNATMSQKKKSIRAQFFRHTLSRDHYRCICCGYQSTPANAKDELDAHHITDRHLMPNGGYVKENGATLCKTGRNCHWLAEQHHLTGNAQPGYRPQDLYAIIGSSYEQAVQAAENTTFDE